MIDETLSKLIEYLAQASPIIWETLVKQVYVQAWSSVVWSVLCFLVVIGLVWVFIASINDTIEDDGTLGAASLFGFLLLGFMGIRFAMEAFSHFYNPNYYAIQLLLEQIK